MKLPAILIALLLAALLSLAVFSTAGKLNLLPYSEVRIVSHWNDRRAANLYSLQKKCLGVWFSVESNRYNFYMDDWVKHYHCEIIDGDKPQKEELK